MAGKLTVPVAAATILRGAITSVGIYPAVTVTPDSGSPMAATCFRSYTSPAAGDIVFLLKWDNVLYALGRMNPDGVSGGLLV